MDLLDDARSAVDPQSPCVRLFSYNLVVKKMGVGGGGGGAILIQSNSRLVVLTRL